MSHWRNFLTSFFKKLEIIMSQEIILKNLDNILSNFMRAYAVKMLDRMKTGDRLNRLRELTFGNKDQFAQLDSRVKALEAWFIENGPLISRGNLTGEMIMQITECVEQIGAYSRGELNSYNNNKAMLFDRKKAGEVARLADRFLSKAMEKPPQAERLSMKFAKGPEPELQIPTGSVPKGEGSKEKFRDSLEFQLEMLEYFGDSKYHLFSIVDNLLNNLERSPDIKTNHLAASILYFLKLNDYKVAPYVERLRKVAGNHDDK